MVITNLAWKTTKMMTVMDPTKMHLSSSDIGKEELEKILNQSHIDTEMRAEDLYKYINQSFNFEAVFLLVHIFRVPLVKTFDRKNQMMNVHLFINHEDHEEKVTKVHFTTTAKTTTTTTTSMTTMTPTYGTATEDKELMETSAKNDEKLPTANDSTWKEMFDLLGVNGVAWVKSIKQL